MSLSVRAARASDLDALTAIERDCFPRPHWTHEDFVKYPTWIAEVGGDIAGFVVIREVFPGEREILNIAVSTCFRRQGVATALLRHALEAGGEVFLEVRESNVAAQNLYRKLGFLEVGRRRNYYQGPMETAIVMKMK